MRTHWLWSSLIAVVMVSATTGQAAACTGIVLRAADGSIVRGRTLEFGRPLDSDAILIPRGSAFTGTTSDGQANGMQWKA
jgi:choloylglycine hydrolase